MGRYWWGRTIACAVKNAGIQGRSRSFPAVRRVLGPCLSTGDAVPQQPAGGPFMALLAARVYPTNPASLATSHNVLNPIARLGKGKLSASRR
jgi:hypothetical protein